MCLCVSVLFQVPLCWVTLTLPTTKSTEQHNYRKKTNRTKRSKKFILLQPPFFVSVWVSAEVNYYCKSNEYTAEIDNTQAFYSDVVADHSVGRVYCDCALWLLYVNVCVYGEKLKVHELRYMVNFLLWCSYGFNWSVSTRISGKAPLHTFRDKYNNNNIFFSQTKQLSAWVNRWMSEGERERDWDTRRSAKNLILHSWNA